MATNDNNFSDLDLDDGVLKGLYLNGFKNPSKIQKEGIKSIITKKDCILQSQSGTGKTATYLLGIYKNLKDDPHSKAIVILPTRELANQVLDVATTIFKYTNITLSSCIGGSKYNNLNSNLLICTLGRLLHMIDLNKINLKKIKIVAIDEADNLLEDKTQINSNVIKLFSKFNDNIQVILISATINKIIYSFSNKYMDDPIKVLVKNDNIVVDLIRQFYVNTELEEYKFDVLIDLYSIISTNQAIIFCNTIRKVKYLDENLKKNNFTITSIHGQMTQEERNEIVKEFRDGETRILLTTDLLARGIDIPHVNLVINYDLTNDKETYIHRIGRCGRFGKKGVAITLVKMQDPSDTKQFNKLKNHYDLNINEMPEDVDKYI